MLKKTMFGMAGQADGAPERPSKAETRLLCGMKRTERQIYFPVQRGCLLLGSMRWKPRRDTTKAIPWSFEFM